MTITPGQIARLRQLHEAGTPGPWESTEHQFNAPPYEGTLEREHGIYPPLGERGPVSIAGGKENERTPKMAQSQTPKGRRTCRSCGAILLPTGGHRCPGPKVRR